MKHLLKISCLFWITFCSAQTTLELTPQGFASLEFKTPDRPMDELFRVSKSWAPYYNKKGYDIFEVTENSLKIEARVTNAFYSYNVGVKYNYDIVYTMKVVFGADKKYSIAISVKEIYAENVLLKTTVSDFFTEDGKLKDDFRDSKPVLEKTINKIVKSYTGYIAQ
jgi:hypothetical protein